MTARYFAPAKINLWLRVFAPDQTGYHPLDTLFCALEIADEIELAQAGDDVRLEVTGADVGPSDRNLAYRAATEFFRATGLPPRAFIRLTKQIPAGAGLGGGSSDAATVLRALNELHGDVLPPADLLSIAALLGSDVPFFLCDSSLAHATGRGEQLRALPALPRAPVIVAVPNFPISTADAYRWLDDERSYSAAGETGSASDWERVAQAAHNDFERVLLGKYDVIRSIKDALLASGPRCALVSGSGSALFAVYHSADESARAARALREQLPTVTVIGTATRI